MSNKVTRRVHSSPEKVAHHQGRMEECFCKQGHRHGIVHRVYAARFYDGIRCLVAWDSLTGGNPVFGYDDIIDIDVY